MKKLISVVLLACMLNLASINSTAHANVLWDFLWDQAKSAAIDYAINHADEIVDAVMGAFSDTPSDSSYYTRRIVADSLNVRENPDKKSRAITQLKYGQSLHVHETTGPNMKWSLIETSDGTKGWVSSDYIAPLNGKGIPVKTTRRINLRMSPESAKGSWNIIGQLEQGTEVLMIRRWTVNDTMWFYVQTPSGLTGWLSSKYVE